MIDGATAAREVVFVAVALLGGYLVGSIPTARLAGAGEGSGWGFLALSIDLAKGVLPVAIGIVSWSWWVGWAAGLGSVLGACLPAFGRGTGWRGLATLGGAAFTLAPPAGAISTVLALVALGIGRLTGRDARVAAATIGLASFPALFLAVHQDLARLGGLFVLCLVVLLRAGVPDLRAGVPGDHPHR